MGSLLSIAPAALRPYSGAAQARSVTAVSAVSVERNRAFDLAIKTTEGDIATLHFAQADSSSTVNASSSRVSISARGRALSLSAEVQDATRSISTSTLESSVSVQGNLSAEETASINALVQQVSGVATDFFAGDLAQAISGAAGINIQGSNLSAFAFDMQSQEVRTGVAVYEDVAASTAPIAVQLSVPTAAGPAATSADSPSWMKSLRALLDGLASNAKTLLQAPASNTATNPQQPLVIDV